MSTPSVHARDVRILRAAREVLRTYTFHARAPEPDGRVPHDVRGGTQPYVVHVHPTWGASPSCSCPDHQRRGGFCKHVIGVLLQAPALRCQLLELFL